MVHASLIQKRREKKQHTAQQSFQHYCSVYYPAKQFILLPMVAMSGLVAAIWSICSYIVLLVYRLYDQ